jgi:hypothetical protein
MTLLQCRILFSDLFARLVLKAADFGYQIAIDSVKRKGDLRLHGLGLAGDLLVYKDGVYITDGANTAYKNLGTWWKEQHPLCRWGGDFTGENAGDGNHFSVTYKGMQ